MPKSEVEVAIVGGGAAGIAAAGRLGEAGIDAVILEARSRLGGRAWTLKDSDGFALDMGCGWLHSADRNPWLAIAQGQRRTIDQRPPPWQRPAPPIGASPEDMKAFQAALFRLREATDALPESEPDRAASAFLEPGRRWNPLIDAVSTYYSGAELEFVSSRDLARYEDTGVNWRILEGYGTVVAAHGADLPVELDCEVKTIDHRGRRLQMETNRGVVEAALAIVTLSSNVIAERADLFLPALPQKTEAAAGLPLGMVDKLFLSLTGAEEFEPDSRTFGNADRTGTGAYQFRPFGRPMIEVYYGGALAAELEPGGKAAFLDFAKGELTGLLGADFAKRIALRSLHLWGADPLARGSYSYALPGKADNRAALAAPVDGRLFFAGEACSKASFSTAHGAYQTGIAAAEQAIAALGRQGPSSGAHAKE
jgi:monoamine oxidase